jgi:hypothetical protein
VEHQEAAFHDRARVDSFALRDHMVYMVRHAPLRVLRPAVQPTPRVLLPPRLPPGVFFHSS